MGDIAGSVVGGVFGQIAGGDAADAAQDAADAQAAAIQAGIEEQRRQFDISQSSLGPYRGVGYNALYGMADMLGLPRGFGGTGGFTNFGTGQAIVNPDNPTDPAAIQGQTIDGQTVQAGNPQTQANASPLLYLQGLQALANADQSVQNQTNGQVTGSRQTGGPVQAGGNYLVGENGPEIVQMPADGNVVPNTNNFSSMNTNVGNTLAGLGFNSGFTQQGGAIVPNQFDLFTSGALPNPLTGQPPQAQTTTAPTTPPPVQQQPVAPQAPIEPNFQLSGPLGANGILSGQGTLGNAFYQNLVSQFDPNNLSSQFNVYGNDVYGTTAGNGVYFAPEGSSFHALPSAIQSAINDPDGGAEIILYNPGAFGQPDAGGGAGGGVPGTGGPGGGTNVPPEAFNWMTSPSYQFRLNQGLQAINRNASGLGNRLAGSRLLGLSDFAGNLASQEYQNVFNNLGTLAGFGTGATSVGVQAGQNTAGNISNLLSQQGAAQAGGINAAGQYGAAGLANFGNTLGTAIGSSNLFGGGGSTLASGLPRVQSLQQATGSGGLLA